VSREARQIIVCAFALAALLLSTLVQGAGLVSAASEVADSDENEVQPKYQTDSITKQVTTTGRTTTRPLERISPSIRAVLSRIGSRGITRANATSEHVEKLSTHFVRVRPNGLIQVYVHVSSFEETNIGVLYEHEVEIEITNSKLGIIQAWIPFDRLDEVARLSFVEAITPPSYESPRGTGK
jgi:hypothetical protein